MGKKNKKEKKRGLDEGTNLGAEQLPKRVKLDGKGYSSSRIAAAPASGNVGGAASASTRGGGGAAASTSCVTGTSAGTSAAAAAIILSHPAVELARESALAKIRAVAKRKGVSNSAFEKWLVYTSVSSLYVIFTPTKRSAASPAEGECIFRTLAYHSLHLRFILTARR